MVAISVANSIVSSRLNYCNSLLCNTTECNLNKLQRIQNTLARDPPTTTLPAGGKDQLSIQGFQYRCTNCLELSVFKNSSSTKSSTTITSSPPSRHIWKQNCSALHTTQSNISSATCASDSNSTYGAAYKCFWHWRWHWRWCVCLSPCRQAVYICVHVMWYSLMDISVSGQLRTISTIKLSLSCSRQLFD